MYKPFDKKDKFPFLIVRMSHLSSNIPSANEHLHIVSSFLLELIRIARCIIILYEFIPRASEIVTRIIAQGGDSTTLTN